MERTEGDRIITALLLLVLAVFLAIIWIASRPPVDPLLGRALSEVAADHRELRETVAKLRRTCPDRARYQHTPLLRGSVT